MAAFEGEENVKQEILIQMSLSHPNVVKLVELFEDAVNIYMVLEYCSGGNLYQLMRREGKLSESETARIMSQIASAVEHF
jgi:serine/threonine protein kinase